jgi:hypothetical protein
VNEILHHLTSPVVLDEPDCGDHAIAAAGTFGGAVPGHWIAAGLTLLALIGGAWLLRRWSARPPALRSPAAHWLATGVLAAVFLALPLLSLHATHHLDGDPDRHCALAGIAHSVAGGVVTAPPALPPPIGAVLPPLPYLGRDAVRLPPQPIARGPPVRSSIG